MTDSEPTGSALPSLVVVTGTDTGVGKTIATAALAAAAMRTGTVHVYKLCQTGVLPDEPGDAAEVQRLSHAGSATEGIRLREPMAPRPAAAMEHARLPTLLEHVQHIQAQAKKVDHVLIEGSGGLLVELTEDGCNLADLARGLGPGCGVVIVARPDLGTLNHTQLTVEALKRRGIPITGLIVGSWPQTPSMVELSNAETFATNGEVPLLGLIPGEASALDPSTFQNQAPRWLTGFRW